MSEEGRAINPQQKDTVFDRHRDLLMAVAYRILGQVADAEDVVQEAWIRWANADTSEVTDPRAFLVRVASRLSIDRLRRLKARKESYVGPWLPEPLLTGGDVAEHAALSESISMAMLVVLETLSPLERAVFVLREAFAMPEDPLVDPSAAIMLKVNEYLPRISEMDFPPLPSGVSGELRCVMSGSGPVLARAAARGCAGGAGAGLSE